MKTSKKIVSVIMAVIFTMSAFSVAAFAAQTKTDALFDKINSGKQISVTIASGDTKLGSSTDKISVKGNAVAYDFTNGFFSARVLLKDNTAYAYLTKIPFLYVKVSNVGVGNADIWKIIEKATGVTEGVLNYVKSYDEELNGTTYYVEEYNDRASVTSKFYYLNDQLKVLKVTNSTTKSVQYTYFDDISFSVDDDTVAVPTGIDVTPLFKFLFAAMISSVIS